jgi:small subunit ribosomal protein S20
MANIKSARKRARQAVKRRDHNMSMRTAVRTAIKNVKKAVTAGDKKTAAEILSRSASILDRSAAKGILHSNAAKRHKSRLAHAVKAMQ